MKKLLAFAIAAAFAFTLCACSSESSTESENATEPSTESSSVTESTHVDIDGIYVDDSYVNKKSAALKRVYLFYTIHTDDENIEATSVSMTMNIGSNEYESEIYKKSCDNMPNYYYSQIYETIYVGDELKVASTFEIPEGDLTEGKEITFDTSGDYTDLDMLKLSTNDIKHCKNAKKIAKEVDPKGFEAAKKAKQPANAKTTARVRNAINGYVYDFYVNNTTYKLEFSEPNKFELQRPVNNPGSYKVLNGFVRLTYDSNGAKVDIPYSWKKSGKIDLDIQSAFSVYEG